MDCASYDDYGGSKALGTEPGPSLDRLSADSTVGAVSMDLDGPTASSRLPGEATPSASAQDDQLPQTDPQRTQPKQPERMDNGIETSADHAVEAQGGGWARGAVEAELVVVGYDELYKLAEQQFAVGTMRRSSSVTLTSGSYLM